MTKPRIRVPAGYDYRTASPTQALSIRANFEATQGRRRLATWKATSSHVNRILTGSGQTLRDRARDLIRNNAYAASAAESFAANVVGAGIVPRSRTGDATLRLALQQAFEAWVDEADHAGRTSFYGLQALVARALFEAGEAFVRPLVIDDQAPGVVPLQLQVFEAEQVPVEDTRALPDGRVVRCGVEMDARGRRLAYWVYPQHPGDTPSLLGANETVRLPAAELLHVYQQGRPGQVRGTPWITRAMVRMHLLDQYDDAELDRKKVAALIAGFIHAPLTGDEAPQGTEPDPADENALLANWQPGTLMKLLPGEQVTFSEPADLGGAYEQFQFRSLSAICAGMGLPYWTVTGDLRQANYSSLRAGLVEFRQRVEQLQYTVLVPQLCRPVWHAWLRTAAMAGTIPGLTPRVLARDWADVSRVEWLAPKQAWVDPEKDAKAEVLEIQAGLKSRSQAVAERGYDVEDVDRQQAEDRQRERALGLAYGMAGAVPPQRSEPDQDEAGQGEAEPAREKAA